jgi:acyl-CoA synthetase (AMP-forming)/AMP-acid ligase II
MSDLPPSQTLLASAYRTVYDAFVATARAYPQHPFLHIPASALPGAASPLELTYAAALERIQPIAARYRERGYGVGHRVALLLENRSEYLLHFLALNAVGVGIVPLNPDYQRAELEYVLGHSEAPVVVALPGHEAKLRALEVQGLQVCVAAAAFDPPPAQRRAATCVAGPHEECVLLYTSGTTGKPKGCIISNYYCVAMGEHYITEGGLCTVRPGEERLITPLPLFHMNALCASTMAMILAGGCVIQLDRFHPQKWWRDVAQSRATIVHYLGVMPAILLGLPPAPYDRAHAVRFGFGANANPKDHEAFEQRFGIPLIEAWAMTETGAGACITASREPRHVGTRCIGTPRAGIEVRIVDQADRDLPDGQPGELLVRHAGPDPRAGFFSGYLKDPDATAQAWRDGWFHTGDAVRCGPDGQLHFVDRQKNIIRRAGENIAALEVEAALLDHPAIRQIAVIAAPDALRGEEVMACIVPNADAPRDYATAVSIQDWCLARLAYFKAPGFVAFVDALPTTATNKVQKARLSDFGANPLGAPDCFDLRDRKKRAPSASSR